MYVKDIYGKDSPIKDLQSDYVASSFAKVAFDKDFDNKMHFNDDGIKNFKKEDILSSLVFMISFNIGQLAYLEAC